MRRIAKTLLLLLVALKGCGTLTPCFAQSGSAVSQPVPGAVYTATQYGQWLLYTYQGNSTTGATTLYVNAYSSQGPNIPSFVPGLPLLIDSGLSSAETVTISSVQICNSGTSNCVTSQICNPGSQLCAVNATFAHTHSSLARISSAWDGLQEAINVAQAQNGGTVLLDATWSGTTANITSGAKGSTAVVVQDNRSGTPQNYQWTGSAYAASGAGGGVTSFNGRAGNVSPATGDYTCAQVTNCNATSGIPTLNGQSGAQTLVGSGGVSITPNGSNQIAIGYAGSAGTGNVGTGINGANGGYQALGTTISVAPSSYTMNYNWTLNQMSGLFTRFSGTVVTSWSTASSVVTMQAVNAFVPGDYVFLEYFTNGTFFDYVGVTILSSGLSNTQFEFSCSGITGCPANQGATADTGYASIDVGPAYLPQNGGLVFVPPGMIDSPSTAFTNVGIIHPGGQVLDWRKGYALQQASAYGVKCDANYFYVSITAGSPTINTGGDFAVNPAGMTMVIAQQSGFGNGGTQNVWTPTVSSSNWPTGGVLTMSSNAPFTYSGMASFGTNNQSALQRAFDDVGGGIPLFLPQCSMLTDTVRWNGASLMGLQMSGTRLIGFPGHDILQQQDGLPITAWSINTTTGLTTFTVPAYAAHHILAKLDYGGPDPSTGIAGDSITLEHFGTSTFFNNQNVNIYSHPTPTTFTVQSVFGQSTSSSTEAGLAAPRTAANTNGLRLENTTFVVDNTIDPSFSWNWYNAAGSLTVEPPYYRPLLLWSQRQNNPLNGWGAGATNGVATIIQGTSVICVPTAGRQPATGTTIVFPYQNATVFSATVSSTAGSCGTGLNPITISTALPNVAAYTASQAEWFTYTTPQTLAVAMPGTITLPYTITLATPFPPAPGVENGVSSHGRLEIGSQQWDYMGDNFGGSAGGSPTITLRNGPTSVNGGSGYAIGSIVFPLNPCQAMYNNPWPVVPTLNGSNPTPLYATYYAGDCGGNAALSLPNADALAYTPESSGWSVAHFIDVASNNLTQNSLGNSSNNGSMFSYQAGNNTGYGNTFDDFRVNGLWGGFMQGPASVNQTGVRSVGPTSTGQSIKNCTFRTGYAIALVNMQQSGIDRCDTYSTEISPYDGTQVGDSMGLNIGYTLSELDGGGVTNVAQFTVKDYNSEPENGNHDEFPASVQSDGINVTWIGTIFEGGYNIFGGSYQIFHGTQLANPVFNYGSNNYFEHMYGLNNGYFSLVYSGSQFYNWGPFSQGDCSNGQNSASQQTCGVGFVQGFNGHDLWASMMGDNVHPNENILGGMFLPAEFGEAAALPVIYGDATELWWGAHSECYLGSGGSQCIMGEWDGFNGYAFIGPHQRITDAKMVIKANFKLKTGTSATFNLQVTAQNPGTGTGCVPNYNLITYTVTVNNTWTPVQIPVDFTGTAGCTMSVGYSNISAANTIETGYFNFVPFPGQLYIPLVTHTVGAYCPVAGEISLDSAHLWTCQPSSGVTYGSGTWQQH